MNAVPAAPVASPAVGTGPTGAETGRTGFIPATSQWTQQPYSPLEQEGRDIYIREGCYNCHSQMIRPFRAETLRYGEYSRLEEFIYDHPYQWGSKRTGPDLHRVGVKYPNLWHYQHMIDPRSTSPGSNMPPYPWLKTARVDYRKTPRKLHVLRSLGVPYSDAEIQSAGDLARAQGTLCLLYTSPSPRDRTRSRMPSSA